MEKFSTVLLASFLYSFFHFFLYPVEAHNFIIILLLLYIVCRLVLFLYLLQLR